MFSSRSIGLFYFNMILISVKSDFMDVKHQEETDKGAEKYLKHVHKLHQTQREYLYKKATAGHLKEEPKRNWYGDLPKNIFEKVDKALFMKTCLPLKIEIINTDANQLNFQHQLK